MLHTFSLRSFFLLLFFLGGKAVVGALSFGALALDWAGGITVEVAATVVAMPAASAEQIPKVLSGWGVTTGSADLFVAALASSFVGVRVS